MQALNLATTREQADIARNRSIAFGVMLDQLTKLTNRGEGRYGSGRNTADALDVDQLRVLASALPGPPAEPPNLTSTPTAANGSISTSTTTAEVHPISPSTLVPEVASTETQARDPRPKPARTHRLFSPLTRSSGP